MTEMGRRSTESVADFLARALADIGVTTIFGVISIHNMPVLDAIARQNRIRFVPARGEAGAMNMADAFSRVSRSLGVVITSTGAAAGNAAGAQTEALSAGSPVLHITTQVDREFMDRDRAAIHDVPRQPDMLRAVSKAYVRMWDATGAPDALLSAVAQALAAPTGPVSLEIPVDVQRETGHFPRRCALPAQAVRNPAEADIAALAEQARAARRPMLWLGGGARGAQSPAQALAALGIGIVTSANGRAIVPEALGHSLGAFNMTPEAQGIYAGCDLMIVAGSRLRGNETLNNKMKLPRPLIQIDIDDSQCGRNYPVDQFIGADADAALAALCALLPGKLDVDPSFHHDIAVARAKSEGALRAKLGPYQVVADALLARVTAGRHPFVRDVTISNSTFGNRYVQIAAPRLGVHALGGGIGQGIAMAVGAALAEPGAKTIALIGDGGAMLGIAELITAADEEADLVCILMNDRAYGVIENIQDAQYQGRRHYSRLRTPDFALLCAAVGLAHARVGRIEEFEASLDAALSARGPSLLEVDMTAIGPFAESFAGPPAGAAGGAR